MKLRYYLRGLGLGMLVCALVLGLANSKHKMTDAQIKSRARELGMVEEDKGVLSALVENPEISKESEEVAEDNMADKPEANAADRPEEKTADKSEANVADTSEDKATDTTADESSNKATDTTADKSSNKTTDTTEDKSSNKTTDTTAEKKEVKQVVVTIYPGEGSYTISKKLANLGLVESADVFDTFLCQNGYDKRLSTGNYTMTLGDTPEKIARRLTGQ